LKGVTDDDKRDAAAGWQLSSRSSRRAGTKRRRVIKSGADDMLELEGAAEDEKEEGDLARQTPPSRAPYRCANGGLLQVDRQAMGIDNKSPDHSSSRFLHSIRRHATMLWETTRDTPRRR